MPNTDELVSLFGWVAAAAVAALVGFLVAVAVRRWAQRDTHVQTFTFQDLRDMRDRGDISDREFEAMRTALLAGYQSSESDTAPQTGDDEASD